MWGSTFLLAYSVKSSLILQRLSKFFSESGRQRESSLVPPSVARGLAALSTLLIPRRWEGPAVHEVLFGGQPKFPKVLYQISGSTFRFAGGKNMHGSFMTIPSPIWLPS